METIDERSLRGMDVISATEGRFLCCFKIPSFMADEHGNWRMEAMAAVMDHVCEKTVASSEGNLKKPLSFNITCFSTVNVEEEMEIEGNAIPKKNSRTMVKVEVRKKRNGHMVANGRELFCSVSHKLSRL